MQLVVRSTFLKVGLLGAALALSAIVGSRSAGAQAATRGTVETPASQLAALTAQVQKNGKVNVIVSLKSAAFDATASAQASLLTLNVDPKANAQANGEARLALANQARSGLLSALASYKATVYSGSDWFIPAIALSVDQAALDYLKTSPLVSGISPDHQLKAYDNASTQMIGARSMWNSAPTPYTGNGQVVAILDTGVQEDHPFLSDGTNSRIISGQEACYSGDGGTYSNVTSFCPGGSFGVVGAGAAAPCPQSITGCEHGTHVAGIAAGYGGYSGGNNEHGIAYQANILPIQVFSDYYDGSTYSPSAFDSDIISALSRVDFVWTQTPYRVAAVNMSLGNSSDYTGTCDSVTPGMTTAINTLRYNDTVATVIASGNSYFSDGVGYPACISSAVSVGAVDFQDNVPSFSNSGPNTTLFAPGVNVYSSIPYGGYTPLSGTSMATPQVVGAFALLRQQTGSFSTHYNLSVSQVVSMLNATGRLIYNANNGLYQSRINVDQAGIVALARQDTIGIYRNNKFYLRNTNSGGIADLTIGFGYGADAYPIVGDWPGGAGFDELGVYNRNSGVFTLCSDASLYNNSTCDGTPVSKARQLVLGNPNDYPIAGRWSPRPTAYNTATIDGYTVNYRTNYATTGVGVFRPTNGILYLKNGLSTGPADYSMVLGSPGDVGIAGDWNMDGQSSPGVYRPGNGVWYLTNQVTNGNVVSDSSFNYGSAGAAGDIPVVGNWYNYNSVFGVGPGVYRSSTGYYFLRYQLNTGIANNSFFYGVSSDLPIVGDWNYNRDIPSPHLISGVPNLPPTILVPATKQAPGAPSGSVPGGNQLGG